MMPKAIATEAVILGAAGAVHLLRRRAGDMSVQAKCMADAIDEHRTELTPDIMAEQIAAMLRNQSGLWDAVSTLSEILDVFATERHRPRRSAH